MPFFPTATPQITIFSWIIRNVARYCPNRIRYLGLSMGHPFICVHHDDDQNDARASWSGKFRNYVPAWVPWFSLYGAGKISLLLFLFRSCSDSTFFCPWLLPLAAYPEKTMGITTLFLQYRTRLSRNTHVQVGTSGMDWVSLPFLNPFRNSMYCILWYLDLQLFK